MKRLCLALLIWWTLPLAAQTTASSAPDPWKALSFLEGTWEAKAQGNAGATASGRYTFRRELGGHILARHSTSDHNCKGPVSFDCEHGDLLYIFEDAPGQPLKAIYFDNEGHVIHYDVSTTTPTTVVFLSEASPGPQFRLVYELKSTVMTGKFEMHMPGPGDWQSYLQWSGLKQ
jgi:uncharacterized protein YaiE (UPF0345 family)